MYWTDYFYFIEQSHVVILYILIINQYNTNVSAV